MNIPILRIPFAEEDKAFIEIEMRKIFDSGILTMGKYTQVFEGLFADFMGAKYTVAVSNGTAALEIILRALEIEGQDVIVPTNTFLATAFAVIHAGNRVVFADSNPDTLCLDIEDVKQRLTENTRAVILVHIGGVITPEVYELQHLCEERGLYLIEDCAHAHGCAINGQKVGTLGVAGGFSFFPTKVLTTGEGGVITTNDESLYRKALMIRNHGKNPAMGNRMSEIGHNQRMSEFTALLGIQQMKKVPVIIEERRRIARFYDEALKEVYGVRPLILPKDVFSTYYKYIAYLDDRYNRSQVKQVLKDKYEVPLTGEVYADLCHTEPVWDKFTYCGRQRTNSYVTCAHWPACNCEQRQSGFPGAEYISKHHICLPMYPGLSETELEYIVDSLQRVLTEIKEE